MPDRLRALIYRPGSLGDTLVSLPAIAEIRRRYPEHRLSLLTEHQLAGSTRVSPWTILKETGWFEDVYFYSVRPTSPAARWRNIALALRLRRNAYDDIFSLAPPRTARQLRVDSCIFRGVVFTFSVSLPAVASTRVIRYGARWCHAMPSRSKRATTSSLDVLGRFSSATLAPKFSRTISRSRSRRLGRSIRG